MKYSFCFIAILLLFGCSLDNKVYTLQFESLKKEKNNYQLVVSTETNLDEIKKKHQFTQQDFIGEIKNRDFRDKSIIVTGNFNTNNQVIKNNKYYYLVDVMITDLNKQNDLTNQLTEKDTITGFLQLSYDMGRTYPTKSINIPAERFITFSK
ncbi:hypothetical protein [Faecalibacter macacae]|uniref:hypothetical protein n=1 Tax=Faecalibacter macacae TaxID=1859289 RepID=UPI0011C43C51|nr:hypothetical protein [Faecalibacter macacae]